MEIFQHFTYLTAFYIFTYQMQPQTKKEEGFRNGHRRRKHKGLLFR